MKVFDHTGQKFGLWTVLQSAGRNAGRMDLWKCQCECGTIRDRVVGAHLRNGRSQGCGCLMPEAVSRRFTKHGYARGGKERPESLAYRHAKYRCENPTDPWFHRYGGRGIQFRFASFQQFIAEIGPRPTRQHSLDRIDNNGHYEAGNVRWATAKEQANNRTL